MALPLFKKVDLLERRVVLLKLLKQRIFDAHQLVGTVASPCSVERPNPPSKRSSERTAYNYVYPLADLLETKDAVLELVISTRPEDEKWAAITGLQSYFPRMLTEAMAALDHLSRDFPDACVAQSCDKLKTALSTVVSRVLSLKQGSAITGVQAAQSDALDRVEVLAACFDPKKKDSFLNRLETLACIRDKNCAVDTQGRTYCILFARYLPSITDAALQHGAFYSHATEARRAVKAWVGTQSAIRTGAFHIRAGTLLNIYPALNGTKVSETHLIIYLKVVTQKRGPAQICIRCCRFINEQEHQDSWKCARKTRCDHAYCRVCTGRSPQTYPEYDATPADQWEELIVP